MEEIQLNFAVISETFTGKCALIISFSSLQFDSCLFTIFQHAILLGGEHSHRLPWSNMLFRFGSLHHQGQEESRTVRGQL